MNENQDLMRDEIEIDLLDLLMVLKARIILLIASAVGMGLVVALFTHFMITPIYSSTSVLYILSSSTSITSLADIQVGTSLTSDYEQLIQGRPIVEGVIENLNLNRTYEQVLQQTTITNPSNTRILKITISDADPELAKDMADEFAKVSIKQLSEIMKTDEPSIAQYAVVAQKPDSPNLLKNTLLGAFLGIFLAAAFVIVSYLMDDTVSTPEDIEKYLGLNTLASIPMKEEEAEAAKKRKTKKKKGRKG